MTRRFIVAALFIALFTWGMIALSPAGAPTPLPKPLPAALSACEGVGEKMQGYCIGLYLRPSYGDASTHTPAGPALVAECIDQYRGQELAMCLTQPIN